MMPVTPLRWTERSPFKRTGCPMKNSAPRGSNWLVSCWLVSCWSVASRMDSDWVVSPWWGSYRSVSNWSGPSRSARAFSSLATRAPTAVDASRTSSPAFSVSFATIGSTCSRVTHASTRAWTALNCLAVASTTSRSASPAGGGPAGTGPASTRFTRASRRAPWASRVLRNFSHVVSQRASPRRAAAARHEAAVPTAPGASLVTCSAAGAGAARGGGPAPGAEQQEAESSSSHASGTRLSSHW
mmetsp:Transcript_51439/g.164691  ORF Transcript_51439/g.164691 Transcript_51439/m.164691 type:complete len:242 (+) Transcript_51439:322-1047(+)